MSTEADKWAAQINEQWTKVKALQAEVRGIKSRLPKQIGPEFENVEEPLARALIAGRHEIKRQVICGDGRVDIFDETTSEIIECKARGNASSISDAVNQLMRYRPHFFDPQLAVAVPFVEPSACWMISALREIGVRVIEVSRGSIGV